MPGRDNETLIRSFAPPRRAEDDREAVLIVIRGEDIGRRFLLNEDRLVLGRDAGAAGIVVSDPAVSARHARIAFDGGDYVLSDLESRNGTFVNGMEVKTVALDPGDRIAVGGTVLKFDVHDGLEADFHSQIDQLMNVDGLTGLFVRRYFDPEYAKAFDAARRNGTPLCVVMLDMDHLKAINDEHGHQVGSHCVAEMGRLIRAVIGERGVICRFGGDEFLGFLRDLELDEAFDLCESLRARAETHRFERFGVRVRPTLSIGLAAISPETRSSEELIRCADDALYRAKRAGKNTVAT